MTGTASVAPLAKLERFLLVVVLALYIGAVALQTADHLYVQPLEAEIARLGGHYP